MIERVRNNPLDRNVVTGFRLHCKNKNSSFENVTFEYDITSETLTVSLSNASILDADVILEDTQDISDITKFFKLIDAMNIVE